ncbi:MAG: LPS export ABC transporter periplasmic protein LptC [Xanthomonadaceae bacterium]|jgi:lipopolysaccharide export system protein LptC|nr:LPS export ABC transporter periplasmic protein LptC [Xanthomonadaceae bacterium]
MSLRRWLRDRRLPVATVLIAVAAGVSQALLWWLGPAPATHQFVGPPRSGYTLTDARLTEYDAGGQPGMRVQSPNIERREGDDSLYLDSPTFQMPARQPGVPEWQGQSRYGWVNKPGTVLKLQGPVFVHRPAYVDAHGVAQPETTMHTSEVTAWPKEDRMETAQPAHIAQGARTMDGIGMRANLNDNHLELLDASHIVFPPRASRPASVRPAPARPARAATGPGQTG